MRKMILAACAVAAIATPTLSSAAPNGCEARTEHRKAATACKHDYARFHASPSHVIYRPGESARCHWHDRTFRDAHGRLMHKQVRVCR